MTEQLAVGLLRFGTGEKGELVALVMQTLWHSALILSDKIGSKARDANPWKTMARFWMHDLGPTPEQCICCEEEELRRAGKPLALDSFHARVCQVCLRSMSSL